MKRYNQIGAFPRIIRRTAGARPIAWLYGHIQEPLDRLVYRMTSGRATLTTWLGDVEMTMLTTTGAKTGLPRTHVVLGMPDGARVIVVASNYGRHHHPAWYHNVIVNPLATIEMGGVTREVVARELKGEDRERYYRRAVDIYPGFTLYQRRAQRKSQCSHSIRRMVHLNGRERAQIERLMTIAARLASAKRLRMIIGHLGEMLPFAAYRADRYYGLGGDTGSSRKLQRLPSEYLRSNFHATTSGSGNFCPPAFACTLEVMGADRVMFSVGLPDGRQPGRCGLSGVLPDGRRHASSHSESGRSVGE